MDRRSKKSLASLLHDRATTTSKYQISRQNSKTSLYITMEQYEKLQKKIERLENEAIRQNKVLTFFVDKIEELEVIIKKMEENNKNNNTNNNYNSNNNNTNNNNYNTPRLHYQQNLNQFQNNSDPIIINSSLSTNINTSTSSQLQLNNNNNIDSVQRLSIMPSNKEKKATIKKLVPFSDIPDGSGNGRFWTKFTQFFKSRPSVETLKEQNIYQNEPCFDTELENVVKHEEYQTIPKIVVECVNLIESKVKRKPTDGLYRKSGDHVEIQKIRFRIDVNDYNCLTTIKDIHTIVGVLKLFLREIKDPLVNVSEIKAFIGSPREWTLAPVKTKILVLQTLIKSLPEQNRDTLSFLLKHFHRITHMPLQYVSPRSLAVSLTPTIFHFTIANIADIHTTMKEHEALTSCLEIMIEYQDKIFEPGFGRVLSKQLSIKWPSCPCINTGRMHLKAIEYRMGETKRIN